MKRIVFLLSMLSICLVAFGDRTITFDADHDYCVVTQLDDSYHSYEAFVSYETYDIGSFEVISIEYCTIEFPESLICISEGFEYSKNKIPKKLHMGLSAKQQPPDDYSVAYTKSLRFNTPRHSGISSQPDI